MELNLRENSIRQPISISLMYTISALITPPKNDSSIERWSSSIVAKKKIDAPDAPISRSLDDLVTIPNSAKVRNIVNTSH